MLTTTTTPSPRPHPCAAAAAVRHCVKSLHSCGQHPHCNWRCVLSVPGQAATGWPSCAPCEMQRCCNVASCIGNHRAGSSIAQHASTHSAPFCHRHANTARRNLFQAYTASFHKTGRYVWRDLAHVMAVCTPRDLPTLLVPLGFLSPEAAVAAVDEAAPGEAPHQASQAAYEAAQAQCADLYTMFTKRVLPPPSSLPRGREDALVCLGGTCRHHDGSDKGTACVTTGSSASHSLCSRCDCTMPGDAVWPPTAATLSDAEWTALIAVAGL